MQWHSLETLGCDPPHPTKHAVHSTKPGKTKGVMGPDRESMSVPSHSPSLAPKTRSEYSYSAEANKRLATRRGRLKKSRVEDKGDSGLAPARGTVRALHIFSFPNLPRHLGEEEDFRLWMRPLFCEKLDLLAGSVGVVRAVFLPLEVSQFRARDVDGD